MPETEYSPDEIEVLDTVTAIRRRPAMYIGPVDEPNAVNTLLAEALCIALDNAATGCASEISISFDSDGSVTVRDNGPGLSVDKTASGSTTIEILLTQLYACRQAKKKVNEKLCGIGLVVTNILSESLVIETVQDGWGFRQEFAQGHATGPIERTKPTTEQWQQITFTPDPEIFGDNRLCPVFFSNWFLGEKFDLASATVTVHAGNQSRQLHPAPQTAS